VNESWPATVARDFLEQFFTAANWRVALPLLMKSTVTQTPDRIAQLQQFVQAEWHWARDSLRGNFQCVITSLATENRASMGETEVVAEVTFAWMLSSGEQQSQHDLFKLVVANDEVVEWSPVQHRNGVIVLRPWEEAVNKLEIDLHELHQAQTAQVHREDLDR
jgi:hypothetical protein